MASCMIISNWYIFLFSVFYMNLLCCACASKKIIQGEILRDGEMLISPKRKFILGFFSPNVTNNQRFVGIWYVDGPENSFVWVANRDKPIFDKNGVFTIEKNGNLVVKNGHGDIMWTSNVEAISNNCTALLSDYGNLVLFNSNNKVLWQSFQHPTDTFLPEMKFYTDEVLRSWTSESDPSTGRYVILYRVIILSEMFYLLDFVFYMPPHAWYEFFF